MIELILIALATYRVTRLVTKDRITETPRLKVQLWFEQRWESKAGRSSDDTWGSKRAYVLGCTWCTSIYVAVAVTVAADMATSVPLPVATVLTASAVTGVLSELGSLS